MSFYKLFETSLKLNSNKFVTKVNDYEVELTDISATGIYFPETGRSEYSAEVKINWLELRISLNNDIYARIEYNPPLEINPTKVATDYTKNATVKVYTDKTNDYEKNHFLSDEILNMLQNLGTKTKFEDYLVNNYTTEYSPDSDIDYDQRYS